MPSFEVGGWRFVVRTSDPELVRDLAEYCRSIAETDRADTRFTLKLFDCTAEGRLPGWGWQKLPIEPA